MIVVFDGFRKDFLDRFNLPNLKRFQKQSQFFSNAYVGHMAAETSVSHIVLASGLQPKELPWQDDIFWDHTGLLGKRDVFYSTANLSFDLLSRLMNLIPREAFLSYQLKQKYKGGVYAIGQKGYAAFELGGPFANSVITLTKQYGKCAPTGIRLPKNIKGNKKFILRLSNFFCSD